MSSRQHLPQLDGVRAVAIALVIAYHLGYLPGGWVGVDVFFVLSGYLITSILLRDQGPLRHLGRFWGRRSRRLLPAVLLLLVVMSAYAHLGGPGVVPAQMRGPALATAFYAANWQQIVAGSSYFAHFEFPSVFQHTWSLAIEEQYYLLWPLILAALVRLSGGRRRRLVAATTVLLATSAVWMGVAAHVFGANRAYLGTDTRAWELLLGGALSMAFPPERPTLGRLPWPAATVAGLAGVSVGIAFTGAPGGWIWDGGLVAMGLGSALVISGVVQAPAGPVARMLSLPPVAWVGRISYSLYLWHWPVIVTLTESTTGLSGAGLLAARLAAMLGASVVSYYAVEQPLRTFDWSRLAARAHVPGPLFPAAALSVSALLVIGATVGPARAGSAPVPEASIDTGGPADSGAYRVDLGPASPRNPYRVWVLGDSVMADAAPGLVAALDASPGMKVVLNSAFPGWGLTVDRAFPKDAGPAVERSRPQIAVGTWSWDDTEALADPVAYRDRLGSVVAALLSAPYNLELVVLLQFPQAGPYLGQTSPKAGAEWKRENAAQGAWDQAAEQVTYRFPGRALYFQTSQVFAPSGRFYEWLRTGSGAWLRARKIDGTHFCPFGSAVMGALVAKDFARILDIGPLRPGWETGPWVRQPRYNNPPGACPNDQPPPGYHGTPLPT